MDDISALLRPYQHGVIDRVRDKVKSGHRRVILLASTGAGKTIMASYLMQRAIEKGIPCVFLAHRKELINQCSEKLTSFGIKHGVVMAGHIMYKPKELIQVCSVQTLSKRNKPKCGLLIIDETHLACAKSYMDLIGHYKDAVVIGLTATPTRLDGKGLGAIYSAIEEAIPMSDLINQGFLVPYRIFAPFTPDMSGVKTVAGDYDQRAASELMDKTSITGDIVKHWKQHAPGRMTICFAASVRHSEHIRDEFILNGISAKSLDAKTPGYLRDKTLEDWRAGKFDVLCNMGLFVEGLDAVNIGCVILGRPTQSLTIYLQSLGRGLRSAPFKNECVILDHAGLCISHGLPDEHREWTLEGKKAGKKKADAEKAPSVTICESCFAAFSRAGHPDACPLCGHGVPKKAVETVAGDGELVELTAEHVAAIKARKGQELKAARTREQLIELGRSRGYKYPAQWSQHIMDQRQKYRGVAYG